MAATGDRETGEILNIAARLFAGLGYDGTSISQIAEASGLDVATLNDRVGGKREIYLAVMKRAHSATREMMEASSAEFADAAPVIALHGMLDRTIDFYAENPEISSLWMHRWMDDALDIKEMEREYGQPSVELGIEILLPMVASGAIDESADLEMAVHTMGWCITCFGSAGILDDEGGRHDFSDRASAHRFRVHLHRMVHRMLGLPGDPP